MDSNLVISSWIENDRFLEATSSYLNSLSDGQLTKKSTTDELAAELSAAIKIDIRNSNFP